MCILCLNVLFKVKWLMPYIYHVIYNLDLILTLTSVTQFTHWSFYVILTLKIITDSLLFLYVTFCRIHVNT